MKKQVIERVLTLILSLAVLSSSIGMYTVYATQVNTDSATSVTESTTAAQETVTQEATQPSVEAEPSVEVCPLEGEGTSAEPYKVADVEDWLAMQSIINDENKTDKNFILVADIDFGKFKSIAPVLNFTGTFNGNGHTLKNITINRKGSAGLFATLNGSKDAVAQITGLSLENVTVNGVGETGALVGIANEFAKITDCHVKNAIVTGSDVVGGLVGLSQANVTASSFDGDVSGVINDTVLAGIGGLIGVMKSGEIKESYAVADVAIASVADSSAENSLYGVGGFIGVARGKLIEKSFSTGSVNVADAAAADKSSVVSAGGLVGISIVDITDSYSSASVCIDFKGSAKDNAIRAVGGLVGAAFNSVNNAYASGSVAATSDGAPVNDRDCFIAGVIGYADSTKTYKNLYFDKLMNIRKDMPAILNVTAEDICGLTTAEMMSEAKLSDEFALSKGGYPYLKAFVNTKDADALNAAILSIVTTTADKNDKSASLCAGVSKPVTLTAEITVESKVYTVRWAASESGVIDGNKADVVRTRAHANYMVLTVSINGAFRTYGRLFADDGAYEASLGNTTVEYKLINNSGDEIMNSSIVGILIKSDAGNGNTVTSDIFAKAESEPAKINNLIVAADGFYVNSSIASGYKICVSAKDSAGNALPVDDMGSKGYFVKTGRDNFASLEITIVKAEVQWGIASLWESIVR